MDARLQVTEKPREVSAGVRAETPLVSIAWRALRAEHQSRADEQTRNEAEAKHTRDALASLAEEAHRLRRTARQMLPPSDGAAGSSSHAQQFLGIAGRMEEALAQAGVRIVAPEGEPFTDELMDLLDNVAQRREPALLEPLVAEVITPAVIYRGALLRMGKAVIAVPGRQDENDALGAE